MTEPTRRETLVLDGVWDVADTVDAHDRPVVFDRRVPVPALTHSATPEFPDVDGFVTPEFAVINKLLGLPVETHTFDGAGIQAHPRNYFWYRMSFKAPPTREVAVLEVAKAQFGSMVWLNGIELGGNNSGFTSAHYAIDHAIRWSGDNELLIRIGANPNVLPEGNTAIWDFEKTEWTPGIWDSVEVHFSDGVSIESVQVAPKIDPKQVTIETCLINTLAEPMGITLTHEVRSVRNDEVVAKYSSDILIQPGERRSVRDVVQIPGGELWSQDSPALYSLDTSTGGDHQTSRFGLREFNFDTATKRAYLNGEQIFLRGGNVCLHRFFDDEKSGTLPWDEGWVRELLGAIPRRLHWNAVKFTVGPVPKKWLDIADEVGLLVLYEFPLWTLRPDITGGYVKQLDVSALRNEYKGWLRDNWNHPSIVYWSASLESRLPAEQSTDIVDDLRSLDLSGRAWGNSWNSPAGPNDPYEFKQYLSSEPSFDMTQLELGGGVRRSMFDPPTGHAGLITEFDWNWLTRDGSPTPYTTSLWESIPYPRETPLERFKTLAYLLAGQVEYWRAHRQYAGVIYLSYLSTGWVVDNFRDVEKLEFQPHFEEFVGEAFKPLGVYINFWQREVASGLERTFEVMMVNDVNQRSTGELSLLIEDASGAVLTRIAQSFEVAALGQSTYAMTLRIPDIEEGVVIKAVADPRDGSEVTVSTRFVELVPAGDLPASPLGQVSAADAGGQFDSGSQG